MLPQEQLQLHLNLINTKLQFDNYVVAKNQLVVDALHKLLQQEENIHQIIYLWGAKGVGCSHLLQASRSLSNQQNKPNIYLTGHYIKNITPALLLDNFELCELICLDDLDCIIGDKAWEEALFHLFNKIITTETKLILSSHLPPNLLKCKIMDLQTRLCASLVFQLQPLTDEDKKIALARRAQEKGFELPEKVINFILIHYSRSMHALFELLDKIDSLSLSKHQAVTLALVKSIINN